MSVRTRFAPSPTGYMHIGGMRTALFAWLWARHNGGTFILRIDDTDQQRNVAEALAPILQAFRWLGLNWDEGPEVGGPHEPYFQSQRGDRYRAAVERLLSEGKAYRDFDPPEVTKADREAAEKEKRNYLNIRRSLELTADEVARRTAAGEPHVIRFLVDRTRKVAIDDAIRGHVEWDCSLMADPVICRQDGSPLYNFATVVDDIDFGITHVIRAEEHLSNSAPQALVYDALGAPLPVFAHIPFVAAPGSTRKLSKRDLAKYQTNPQFKKLFEAADAILPRIGLQTSESLNPVMVSFYETVGFLPEAVLNALSRIGWSLDDKTENMSLDFVVENFSLDRVVKAAAGFDPDKLLAFQEHWMAQLPLDIKVDRCLPFLIQAGWVSEPVSDEPRAFVGRLITSLGDRLKLFGDILRYDEYFVADSDLAYDEKVFDKRLLKPKEAATLLRSYRDLLAQTDDFSAPALDQQLHAWVESQGVQVGQIIHALRVATTGKGVGPGMFDCLSLLGKKRCLARIDQSLAQ
ncbi:MAG: glutamate--tRNA ligase, partial [Planctomycetaceae bacterium]